MKYLLWNLNILVSTYAKQPRHVANASKQASEERIVPFVFPFSVASHAKLEPKWISNYMNM